MLLVDEVDRADDEFEAFLLEVLSTWQVTIPELGTVRAATPPVVVLTSNRTRELHDALKRRCLYHWVEHPGLEREVQIVRYRRPRCPGRLARQVARPWCQRRRGQRADLQKPPGVAETLDWARCLRGAGLATSSTSRRRPPPSECRLQVPRGRRPRPEPSTFWDRLLCRLTALLASVDWLCRRPSPT